MHEIRNSGDIARLLRQARKAQGLTQSELSGLTGRESPKAVNAAEQGNDRMELATLLDLAAALGIRIFAGVPEEAVPLALQASTPGRPSE